MLSVEVLRSIWQDTVYAARGLRRNRGFALTAIGIVAVGLGATTSMFSVVDRLLFRNLPYGDGERMVALGIKHPLLEGEFLVANDYLYLRDRLKGEATPFGAVTSWTGVADCDLTEQNPQRLACAQVEWSFLPTLGMRPAAGRNFAPEDDRPNAPTVAIISYALSQARFGGEAGAVGKTISVDGAAVKVIGVLPRDFELPTLERADLLVPQALRIATYTPGESGRPLRALGRLKPGITVERAREMLRPFFQTALGFMAPQQRKQAVVALDSMRDFQIHDVKLASWVLLGTTLAVLLMVCANVTNLLLARNGARQREFAMRLALGAGRGRLMRQTMVESVVLCGCGALGGVWLAWAMLEAVRALAPAGIPRIGQATLDVRVLLFAAAATLVCGVGMGMAPAFSGLRLESLAGWRSGGSGRHGMRRVLVTAQIAVSLVLVSDAGLLMESLRRMTALPAGVDTEHVVAADITVGPPRYSNAVLRQQFFDRLAERLRANPRVSAVAISDSVPPSGFLHNHPFSGLHVVGRAPMPTGTGGVVWRRTVSAEYFRAVGVRIARGRGFDGTDLRGDRHVMVLSATLGRRLFGTADPVGQFIHVPMRGGANTEVIGVAADTENTGEPGRSEPEYYVPRKPAAAPPANANAAQLQGNQELLGGDASLIARALHVYDGEGYVIVRSAAPAESVAGWIRSEAAAMDATVPLTVTSMQERVRAVSARPRFNAVLLTLFAAIGVLLAAFGLYGLIGFLVVERTREIGVRMALGATPPKIARLVLGDGLRWTAAGVAAGLVGAVLTARGLAGILFGVTAENPAMFGAAATVLVATAIVATVAPAVRAARVDPVEALRRE